MNTTKPHYDRKPLSEASERLRYQVRHLDMMDDLANAFGLIRRHGFFVTAADVSPELAAYIKSAIEKALPYDNGETASYWSEA